MFEHAYPMTSLAGEVPVLAQLPGLKRLLHHMAGGTEVRVLLGVFVIPETHDPTHYGKQQEEQYDRLLVFLYEMLTK